MNFQVQLKLLIFRDVIKVHNWQWQWQEGSSKAHQFQIILKLKGTEMQCSTHGNSGYLLFEKSVPSVPPQHPAPQHLQPNALHNMISYSHIHTIMASPTFIKLSNKLYLLGETFFVHFASINPPHPTMLKRGGLT